MPVILTTPGFVLLLLPSVLMAASMWRPELAWWSVGLFGAIVALAWYDGAQTSRRVSLMVLREVDEKLSLGAENRVVVRVASRSRVAGALRIKDDAPPEFATTSRCQTLRLQPYDELRMVYYTRPLARGRFGFGAVHVRGRSSLGLAWWQKTFPLQREVSVYPDLLEVGKYAVLARADRLAQVGIRLTRYRGQGQQFESLRDYTPDDEFRHIDWKATARRRKPITRQYEMERSQSMVIMVDAGRMMSGLIDDISRLDYAVNAALMLAYVGIEKGDAVGLIAFADTVEAFLPPRKGHQQVGLMAEALYDLKPAIVEPDYAEAFGLLYGQARKRALVVCFTDLVDTEASRRLLAHMTVLAPRHLPLLVTLQDSGLMAAAREKPAETFGVYRRALAQQVEADRATALAVLRQRGVMVLDTPPEKLTVGVVNQYLSLKARGRL